MRQALLLQLFIYSFGMIAQIPGHIKYDRIEFSYDSTTAIIIKGTKYGVYDVTNQKFLIVLGKSRFVNFPNTNLYAEVSPATNSTNIHWFHESGNFSSTGQQVSYLGICPTSNDGLYIESNDKAYNYTQGLITPSQTMTNCQYSINVAVEKIGETAFIINSYRREAGNSLDQFNGLISPQPFQLSGVYNTNNRHWMIEPKYESCHEVNGYIFCQYLDTESNPPELWKRQHYYDVYKKGDDGSYFVISERIQNMDVSLLQEIFGSGYALPYSDDNAHFVICNDRKFGLIYFTLFNAGDLSYPDFIFSELLPAEFDFIAVSSGYRKVITLRDTVTMIYQEHAGAFATSNTCMAYYDTQPYHPIQGKYVQCYGDFYESTFNTHRGNVVSEIPTDPILQQPSFGVKLNADSTLIVHNYRPHNWIRVPLINSQGEDSTYIEPSGEERTIYANPSGGFFKSGVFDLKTGAWIIEPEMVTIAGGTNGYIVQFPYAIDNDPSLTQFGFGTFSQTGERNWMHIQDEDFVKNPTNYMRGYEGFKADTTFAAPNGFYKHSNAPASTRSLYYMIGKNQMGVYQPNSDFSNQLSNKTYEFIHYNPDLHTWMHLDGDSIYFEFAEIKRAVSRKGKFIYQQPDINRDPLPDFWLYLIDNSDTSFIGEQTYGHTSITYMSIELIGHRLIVNDYTSNSCESSTDGINDQGIPYHYHRCIGTENSSIWEKRANGWTKISPYYHSIVPLPNGGYIVSTGKYEEHYLTADDRLDPQIPKIDQRYLILDSNLMAKSYYDYFDFPYVENLGFGLKVKLDSGDKYFFMTYDGRGVTNAEWDDFELENGKLKAILRPSYLLDDDGSILIDENGYPVEAVSETVSYFSIK